MTEAEWLACRDPRALLRAARPLVTGRKAPRLRGEGTPPQYR